MLGKCTLSSYQNLYSKIYSAEFASFMSKISKELNNVKFMLLKASGKPK